MVAKAESAQAFLDRNGISQAEVAEWYDVDPSTISRKLAGVRQWRLPEIDRFLKRSSKKLGRPVTFEEAFCGAEPVGVTAS